jgi:hypothetical protein
MGMTRAQRIHELLCQAGYPPVFLDDRDQAISVWYWVGTMPVVIERDYGEWTAVELADDIAIEAERRGVRQTAEAPPAGLERKTNGGVS